MDMIYTGVFITRNDDANDSHRCVNAQIVDEIVYTSWWDMRITVLGQLHIGDTFFEI
jgi:hypothetical protein